MFDNTNIRQVGGEIRLGGIVKNAQPNTIVIWKKKYLSIEEVKAKRFNFISTTWPLLNDGEKTGEQKAGEGVSLIYICKKEDEGKYVKFYAYVNNVMKQEQAKIYYIEPSCNTNARIRGVARIDSDSTKATIGQKIRLKVNKYSVSESKVSDSVKESIKWMVRIDGKEERLIIDGIVKTGAEIDINVPEDWKGKEVILMPYLNKWTEKISAQIKIDGKFYYKGTKKWGNLQKDDKSISGILKQGRQAYISHDKAGTMGAETIDRLKKETEEELRLIYEGKGVLNLGTKDVLSDDTADLVLKNFYSGKGKKLSFDENTKISKDLTNNSTFKAYFNDYLKVVKEILENKKYDINTINGEEIGKIFREKQYRYSPNFSNPLEIFKYDYYGLMGGTQTITVDLEIEEENNKRYKVTTKMYIGDWYGSDWGDVYQGKSYSEIHSELSDNYSTFGKIIAGDQIAQNAHAQFQLQKTRYRKGYISSLNAFFMLQHYHGNGNKYIPFETEIIYKSENTITIDK